MRVSPDRTPVAAVPRSVIVKRTSGWISPKLGEVWLRRELLYFFVWRDLKARYAQTLLGAAWTVFQPLALMLVFTLAFRRLARIETGDIPYPVFALAGLAFWMFFARAVARGAESLVSNAQLLTKAYFPRLITPLASLAASLVDFLIAFALFLVIAAAYGELPSRRLALAPLIVVLGGLFALGLVLLLSAANVRYRDVGQALPFLLQITLFLSPIAYPLSILGAPWTTIVAVNPLVGIVEAFRWSLLDTPPPSASTIGLACGIAAVLLAVGAAYFSRVERTLADVI